MGGWKQMNEALMLSPHWVSVSASAVRLKQRVEKAGQTFSFLQGTRWNKAFNPNNVYLLRAVRIDLWKAFPIPSISFPVNVGAGKQGKQEFYRKKTW